MGRRWLEATEEKVCLSFRGQKGLGQDPGLPYSFGPVRESWGQPEG